jgi:hypothetical protein
MTCCAEAACAQIRQQAAQNADIRIGEPWCFFEA